jgi:hypothetical protein
MLIGAMVARYWARKSPRTFALYGYAVIAGFTTGEGIGGIVNAGLQLVGVSGERVGTGVGCPGGVC